MTLCKHCGRVIEQITDPWGGVHGWHHPELAYTRDDDYGAGLEYCQSSCGREYRTDAEPEDTMPDAPTVEDGGNDSIPTCELCGIKNASYIIGGEVVCSNCRSVRAA